MRAFMNDSSHTIESCLPERGRILAIDLGTKQTGVAVCDESRTSIRPVKTLPRTSWKRFVADVQNLCAEFDAQAIVIGLPLNLDGTRGAAAEDAQRIRRNLQLTLRLPVLLQDERLTSRAAEEELRAEGASPAKIARRIHTRAAEIILRDFIAHAEHFADSEDRTATVNKHFSLEAKIYA